MPRNIALLSIMGIILALALAGGRNVDAVEIQGFPTSGPEEVDWTTCFGGAAPAGGTLACGAGSSATAAAANTALDAWQIVKIPAGSRLVDSLLVYAPHGAGQWQEVTPGCAPVDGNNECIAADITGSYTAQVDLLCSGGTADIMATSSSSSGVWPGATWDGFDLTRTAAGATGEPSGGTSGYVPNVRPQPTTFSFVSIDSGTVTTAWLAGVALFPLPVARPHHVAVYESAYVSGLRIGAILPGDPVTPPTDDYICDDSPGNSITHIDYLRTPAAAGLYPRWAMMQSALDIVDGSVSRILDTQCMAIGGGAPDADGDCLSDAADGNDANPDQDGDLVPDGVETAGGSSLTSSDTDGDGASDFAELAEMTDPNDIDTDNDGSADKLDNGADEVPGTPVSTVNDSILDDNCPADANAAQTNTDSAKNIAGPSPGFATDATNPDQDTAGDACDLDDDNDNLPDIAEGVMTIVAWSGNTDPGGADAPDTTVCKGPGIGVAPAVVMNPLDRDSDDDIYLDGIECQMSSRPDVADLAIASCITAPVDPDGCARIERAGVTDPDVDKLFHPTSAGGHGAVEGFYRTRQINLDASTQTHDTDGDALAGEADADSDADAIRDGPEVWSYGTSPANPDTDGDGCSDGKEAGDINGNRVVNVQDLALITNPASYGLGAYRAANGTITALIWKMNADFNRDAVLNAADMAFLATVMNIGSGRCNNPPGGVSNQLGRVITSQTK